MPWTINMVYKQWYMSSHTMVRASTRIAGELKYCNSFKAIIPLDMI